MTSGGNVIKLEGEYEQVEDAQEMITRRVKEHDKVSCPKFPTAVNLKVWHNQLVRNVILASGRTDHAEVEWLNAVLSAGSKFEDFATSGGARFATLDLKLHAAVTQCIKEGNKTLASKMATLEDECMLKSTIIKGRQLVWMIHHWFRVNPEMKPVYGLKAITDLVWYGDDKIQEFLDMWLLVSRNNSIQLNEGQLAELLVQKMETSKVLAQDVAYWRRLAADDAQRTYQYLLNAMQSHLDRVQMNKNLVGQNLGLNRGGREPVLPAAGGASTAGGGKRPCYFFNHGGCKNSTEACKFLHVMVSDAEKAVMTKPERRDRSQSPRGDGGGNQGGGRQFCRLYLKGKCTRGDACIFTHVEQSELDRADKAKAAAKADPKAKAKAKGKAKAKAQPLATRMSPRAAQDELSKPILVPLHSE